MGFTKDLWTRPEKQPDGEIRRVPNARWGRGKRWLACWLDPDERERTKAFTTKTPATKYWQKMEADRDRGEYVDPKAGKGLVAALGTRWLGSVKVDPATKIKYEQILRLHVGPAFGQRAIKSMRRPSEVQAWLTGKSEKYGDSTVMLCRLVLGGMLELAVVDGDLRKNPVRSRIVSTGKAMSEKVTVWQDSRMWGVIDAHPEPLRAMPIIGATCGHREGELFAIAEDDIDEDREIIHIRRQLKRLGNVWVFALPKNNTEREVPLASSSLLVARNHVAAYKSQPITLPWERPDGELRTYRLMFVHPDTGRHLKPSTYDRYWDNALAAAGVEGRTRRDGRHAMRHFYAGLQLAGGTTINELAVYLGHHDPAFTLRVYGHLQPDSHDRARRAVDTRFFRPRSALSMRQA
ncbi:tyrosine-type recombinase/integrase [Amycolatopsis sp. FBCC-B4732]|uniref:tyrosine-type recombinase/integrase n=1 Tax=Amycolatopsis sp. FBCC-B4732 TaxID=3079339 RepID=UPI001FF0E24D|nr:tyrosine-type recombinase/integrase [Amycolatopsis sp. FBCC-B4732]UOX85320.1 tyrosine-type recombinase/integrase [Amycolatopsis sp. FBCC-B4732]